MMRLKSLKKREIRLMLKLGAQYTHQFSLVEIKEN